MEQPASPAPRLVVAGLSGDSGKTLISLGLLLLARERGIPTTAFKKGPDYIDAAWLGWASGSAAWNLDTFLMGREGVAQSFLAHALPEGLNVIEGNRGLYDGFDASGTHSTAELAKLLGAPVLLVVTATKLTHTVAALVLGCQKLDPEVSIYGVILNRVGGRRHEAVLRESVESACGLPVLGVLPKMDMQGRLPSRHLGLVTPEEHGKLQDLRAELLSLFRDRLNFDRIFEMARGAPAVETPGEDAPKLADGRSLKIAYVRDSAFTFYYPDNLEALEKSGARLEAISALAASTLPDGLDGLYIGGGFPETHAEALSANTQLLASIREHAKRGLPIYAECGGLMLLSQAIRWEGKRYPMSGVLPFEVEVSSIPRGHGYVELLVDRPNPYYSVGTKLRGHEFHNSAIVPLAGLPPTACEVLRGTGSYESRDGVLVENVWASYTHIHAVGAADWAKGFLAAARRFSNARSGA